MSTIPIFSVVIPVWNKKPHIARAVGSVLAQTFGDFELIAVDDCSTDGSMAEFAQFSDPRICFVSHGDGKSRGPGGARNVGIREARGEWISFLDADDSWEAGHLSEMAALTRQYPQAGMLSSAYMLAENDEMRKLAPYARKYVAKGPHTISFEEYLRLYVTGLCPVWTSVVSIKRTVMDTAGFFPEGIVNSEDIDQWLRVMSKTQLAWSPAVGAVYYENTVNKLTKFNAHRIHDNLPTIDAIQKSACSVREQKWLRKYKNMMFLHSIIIKIRNGRAPSMQDLAGFDWHSLSFLSL